FVYSFVYWSNEQFSDGRPIVSATHVTMIESADEALPEVLVASKQIFATHYFDGSLGITAMVVDHASGTHYLVYLNRSHIDVLVRCFARMARSAIEDRVTSDASRVLLGLRERRESGEPPSTQLRSADEAPR